jgi:hypothetical protein
MDSAFLLRVGSQVLCAIMGGMAIFCLYYAGSLPDPQIVRLLFGAALKWGGLASAIVYCQGKYLG